MRISSLFQRGRAVSTTTPPSNGAERRRPGATVSPTEHAAENRIVANARREFAGVFGDLARGKRNWQLIAFALAGVLGVETISAARLAFSARIVPYVVRVDQLGRVAADGAAEPLRDPDARLVASQLADFIRSVRTVLPLAAVNAQTAMLRHGYALVAPEGASFLNAYFAETAHDPRALATRLVREVDVSTVLRVPDASTSGRKTEPAAQTWRLQWIETDRPTQPGDSSRVTAWEGYLTIRIVPPTAVETVQENPLGLYVTSVAWTRVARRVVPDSASEGGSR